ETAVGVEKPDVPPVKYEPMTGVSSWERRVWLAVCVAIAIGVSSWTGQAWQLGGGELSTNTSVTLAADGAAEERVEYSRPYSSYYRPSGFSFYAAKGSRIRFLDAGDQELPSEIVETGSHTRYDIDFTDSVFNGGQLRYTRVSDKPRAAKLNDGIWTFEHQFQHAGGEMAYRVLILLPRGATLVSTDSSAKVSKDEHGISRVLFDGRSVDGEPHTFTVRYRLGDE
ncbi:MAG: hypothetical protein MI861_00750, partial [Pirellulales bacterium]|nr:hypothetical protein [Pirellulales bacterium]